MKNLFYLFLTGAAVVTACQGPQGDVGPQGSAGTPGTPGPQGVVGPNHRGDLTGFAELRTETNEATTDYSSVSVTAESNGVRTTGISDRTGKFTLPNLMMGTYTLTYERTGHGMIKVFGVQHIGGSTAPNPVSAQTIYAQSTTQVNNLRFVEGFSSLSAYAGLVFATTRVDNKGETCNCRGARVYLSKDPNPTQTQYEARLYIYVANEAGKELIDRQQFLVDDNYINKTTFFKKGDVVYAVAYGVSWPSSYTDPATNHRYITGLNPNPSNIVKITWP